LGRLETSETVGVDGGEEWGNLAEAGMKRSDENDV
jgi:hypothetical protein